METLGLGCCRMMLFKDGSTVKIQIGLYGVQEIVSVTDGIFKVAFG